MVSMLCRFSSHGLVLACACLPSIYTPWHHSRTSPFPFSGPPLDGGFLDHCFLTRVAVCAFRSPCVCQEYLPHRSRFLTQFAHHIHMLSLGLFFYCVILLFSLSHFAPPIRLSPRESFGTSPSSAEISSPILRKCLAIVCRVAWDASSSWATALEARVRAAGFPKACRARNSNSESWSSQSRPGAGSHHRLARPA